MLSAAFVKEMAAFFFFPEVSNCLLIFQHIKSIIIIVPDMCWLCQGLRKIKPSRSAVLNCL